MVWNNVEKLAQLKLLEGVEKLFVAFFSAKFLVDLLLIDDVVSMHAAFSGLHIGRAIDMRDSEILQIRKYSTCVGELEAGVELYAV